MYLPNKTNVLVIFLLAFFVSTAVFSQKIYAPILPFSGGYMCLSDKYPGFNITVQYDPPAFKKSNEFYLEMSSPTGSFDNPTVLAGPIKGENTSYEFTRKIIFDANLSGQHYKIRVRSTAPAMVSDVTTPFEAHYVVYGDLNLNHWRDVSLCQGNTASIAIENAKQFPANTKYIWYLDGVEIPGETASSLTVSKTGYYNVEANYGHCTGSLYSNMIEVKQASSEPISIQGTGYVKICSSQGYVLKASKIDSSYEYRWYKDDVLLNADALYAPSYSVASNIGEGVYRLEVNTGSCVLQAVNTVEIQYTDAIAVDHISSLQQVILPGEQVLLEITTDAANYHVEWFKDNKPIFKSNTLKYYADQPGEYYAKVTKTGLCGSNIYTDTFVVLAPEDFIVHIGTEQGYQPCFSDQATLRVVDVEAITAKGNVVLTDQNITHLQLQWYYKDTMIADKSTSKLQDNASITIKDPTKSGMYHLKAISQGVTANSNIVDLRLGMGQNLSIVSDVSSICKDNPNMVIIDVVSGVSNTNTYQWYKNGQEMIGETTSTLMTDTVGEYKVSVSSGACTQESNVVTISHFKEDAVVLQPSGTVMLKEGESQTITASGADTYLWYTAQGALISNIAELNVTDQGIYKLVATVGSCKTERYVTVIFNNAVEVPNVITLNGDGANDTWDLPKRYIGDKIRVIIYAPDGTEVFNATNYQNNWPDTTLSGYGDKMIYYYSIIEKNGFVKKGTITIIR